MRGLSAGLSLLASIAATAPIGTAPAQGQGRDDPTIGCAEPEQTSPTSVTRRCSIRVWKSGRYRVVAVANFSHGSAKARAAVDLVYRNAPCSGPSKSTTFSGDATEIGMCLLDLDRGRHEITAVVDYSGAERESLRVSIYRGS